MGDIGLKIFNSLQQKSSAIKSEIDGSGITKNILLFCNSFKDKELSSYMLYLTNGLIAFLKKKKIRFLNQKLSIKYKNINFKTESLPFHSKI